MDLRSDIYSRISFKFGMAIDITEHFSWYQFEWPWLFKVTVLAKQKCLLIFEQHGNFTSHGQYSR